MTITTEEQMETDFDWFCVDDETQVAHFTTAGFKRLPASVAGSVANQAMLLNYFEQELWANCGYSIDPELINEVNDPNERHLKSFVQMANRGLYSFDIEPDISPATNYFRVAIPTIAFSSNQLHPIDSSSS